MESSDNYMAISPVGETEVAAVQEESEFLGPNKEDEVEETVNLALRKRGRPKKYENSFVPDVTGTRGKTSEKRGRGRPRGSSNRQLTTSGLGGHALAASSGDGNFTPLAVTVQRGEDIVEKVWAFVQKGIQALCILTASGPVSVVELRPGRFGPNVIRHEGYFEILTLVGSQMFIDGGGEHRGPLMLNTTLACQDGRVFGGAICGSLIAAAPVQLVLGIIKQGATKKASTKKRSVESPNPQISEANITTPNVSLPDDKTPEKSIMTPLPMVMSPPNGAVNIEGDQSEGHHASPGRSDGQNGSQPLDRVSGETLPEDNNVQDASQPLDDAPGETDGENGVAHDG